MEHIPGMVDNWKWQKEPKVRARERWHVLNEALM